MIKKVEIMKKVAIQGLGFVGSAMSTAFASKLNTSNKPIFYVTGIDLKSKSGQHRMDSNNSGTFPFETNDKNLKRELKNVIKEVHLKATNTLSCLKETDIVLVSINSQEKTYSKIRSKLGKNCSFQNDNIYCL